MLIIKRLVCRLFLVRCFIFEEPGILGGVALPISDLIEQQILIQRQKKMQLPFFLN